jgi:hypothetical protein
MIGLKECGGVYSYISLCGNDVGTYAHDKRKDKTQNGHASTHWQLPFGPREAKWNVPTLGPLDFTVTSLISHVDCGLACLDDCR